MKLLSKDDLDDVQLAMLEARFNRFATIRPIIVLILVALLLLTLLGDHAVWRRWILAMLSASALVGSVLGLVRNRRRSASTSSPTGPRPHIFASRQTGLVAVLRTPAIAALSSGAFFLATGGLDSPLLPIVIMLCFFIGTLAPARRLAALTLTFSVTVLCMAIVSWSGLVPDLMPAVFGGGPRVPQPSALLWARTGALLVALGWAALVSSAIRDVFRRIVGDAFNARDEVLKSHDAHARELTALSGELAHELKNPLANMKGLAVLVGRDVQGKGLERLSVLQHEIARMEEILQSFLTFSRPLSELTEQSVDLNELCESVVTLHEGMAHAKNITLELRASTSFRVSCDPRKVKQIFINLVQNALQASPWGGTVEIALLPGPETGVQVEIRDHGPGIPPEVRAHLFEPGSTTKERGTGLGLVLARGLTRQHGGELTLEDRDGGGCTAVVALPDRSAMKTGEAA